MANPPQPPQDGIGDDFFEQIFSIPAYDAGGDGSVVPVIVPQYNFGDGSSHGTFPVFPLELSLEQGRSGFSVGEGSSGSSAGRRIREGTEDRDPVQLPSLFPAFGHIQSHHVQYNSPQVLHGQSLQAQVASVPQASVPRPRVRARRGQATDPHSIAERELVPNTNKTDRAAMLDEIVDYVKFLRLQVKVLSMSRLGGAGAVAQLVADIPLSLIEGDSTSDGRSNQQVWDKWSTDGTEKQVTKLMEEDVGAAMQFLQSKALCIMPISLAAAIYNTQQQQPENSSVKNEPNTPPS